MAHKGNSESRAVRHGKNKGKRTTLITIRKNGKITHSYRPKSARPK